MITSMREKFGPIIVGGIISVIVLVFLFTGVFTPGATKGLHEGAVAGIVNGERITLSEFNREYTRRVEMFKNLGGGAFNEAQLKAFRIKEGVFNELVNRKLMIQAAKDSGIVASDEEVKNQIQQIPAFQKDGKFDPITYKNVITANNLNPGGFEKLVREDLSLQKWSEYLRDRVKVSEAELTEEFKRTNDKRNIKYVVLSTDVLSKSVKVDPAEIKKYLAVETQANLVKNRYEQEKDTTYKGKSFDEVKETIARNILAAQKSDETRKLAETLAGQIQPLLTASKSADPKINALLKPHGLEVKNTNLISVQASIPGVNDPQPILNDAFASKSPIDAENGGQAKVYDAPSGKVVALVTESKKPDLSQLAKERKELVRQINARKERELMGAWIKDLSERAKIERNEAVISDAAAES